MIKTSCKSLTLPLKLIFILMFDEGVFPEDWEKKGNVVPIHKKDSKHFIKNYRPISFFPILSKVFERLVFNSLFNYFMQHKLFTHCQSSFIPGDP